MVFVLTITSVLVYHWSYKVLWFRVGSLFDIVVTPSSKDNSSTFPRWELDDNTFFYKFYSEYSVSSNRIERGMRILFSTAMVCYTITIEIILWQIKTADVQQKADFVTSWVWPFASLLLSVLLLLIQPFFIVMSLLNKFFNDKFDIDRLIILSSGSVILLITALNFTNIGPFRYAENMLTKLSIVGITIMATLSGIASMSTLYYTFLLVKTVYFRPVSSEKETHSISSTNTRSLLWTADELVSKQMEEYEHKMQEHVQILNRLEHEPGGKSSVLRDQLIEKIGCYQLELGKLENRIQTPTYAIFFKKIFHFSFLLYCFHKVIVTFSRTIPYILTNLIKHSGDISEEKATTDWVTDPLAITVANVLDFFLFRFNYQYELDSLTKQISLILSTSLFVCSLSAVATTISYVIALLPTKFRILAMHAVQSTENSNGLPKYNKDSKHPNPPKSPSIIKNLIVSELAGVYVVATILSIRSNLPFEVSEKVNELLGERFTVPNIAIDSWFEIIYVMSCIFTIICIKFAERILLPKKL